MYFLRIARLLGLAFISSIGINSSHSMAAVSPEQILKNVDDVRNPSESYQMRVRIGDSLFEVKIEGNSKTLIETLEPARDHGRDMLMIGEEMWAYVPNLKRAVRVSLSQKLTGQAANGDISRMRWAGDYQPKVISETPQTWTLDLTALKKGLTYERIRVEVEKKTFHPQTAEFQTASSKPLKRAVFGRFKLIAGRVRPTELQISSAVNVNERSTIQVEAMEKKAFPAALFNPQRFSR
ncbi:MAG: outer membrane lipoprotein-sorting protein [Bdellovibrionales bacterium]|nr:outer membrane lipoprotein-sorting protein [Bdellovibrionales bacterium]